MIYIALLRGINIGGHQVRMERLRALFEEVGLERVRSYIQTGNVFFDAPAADEVALAKKIEAHLEKELGWAAPVMLRTVDEVESIIALNPFKGVELTADKRFCILFSAQKMPVHLELPVVSPKNDAEIIGMTDREAFAVWHIINGKPPANTFFAKTLPKDATSRFYHTTIKILEAAKS